MTRRKTVPALMAAVLATVSAGLAMPAQAAPPGGQPSATFTWSMAERTKSIVNDEFYPDLDVEHRMILGPDGLPGLWAGVSSVPLDEINPADGYSVDFDACGSTGNITQYDWAINGARVQKSKSCRLSTMLPAGPHTVSVTTRGGGRSATATQTIEVKDLLVVSMGDSYSSGEGNPTRFVPGQPDSTPEEIAADNGRGWSQGGFWDQAPCHRSTRSGQAQAAIDLERADPHTSVTFLYLACSGSQIDNGILGGHRGEHPQVRQAHELAVERGRSIDAVTLGIGGNDIGFVATITECALQVDCFLSTEGPLIGGGTPALPVTSTEVVNPGDLGSLLLKPDAGAPDMPGFTPSRVLKPETLHACIEEYQRALAGSGGADCREAIGSSPLGLVQVAQCLTGSGDTDCQPLQGEAFPGLEVEAKNVFYTDYPDLTKKFVNNDPGAGVEYCNISLTKAQLVELLRAAQDNASSPEQAEAIGAIIFALQALGPVNIGLTANEFQYADLAVLRGTDMLPSVQAALGLTGPWNVRTRTTFPTTTTIGPGRAVDFINLQSTSPALSEITRGSRTAFGWTPATTYEGAIGHGLCAPGISAAPRSVAAYAYLLEAIGGETVSSGVAHPNLYGQQLYQQALSEGLISRFVG